MCNHNLKLSTKVPNALLHNLNQMNTPANTTPSSPKRAHSPKSPPSPPSNLHPKAHDTHFPLNSPKKPSPKRAHKKPTGGPRPICSTSKLRKEGGAQREEEPGVLQGFALMAKSSSEPRKEFRESMMEMIRENGLMTVKDLEELLECYLCLNSKEYHRVIIEVFEEIWFDIVELNVEFGV
ncbi:uncharacterized protein A4U43_C02F6860 [Asparagus officinalis]|uniref:Transcription repressor n=1 Tax=Asparagus officinalis TaxID=4686 RepID=A0A5P1FLB7_ASPOF|nr:transcription repressor OFP3-like [Asparagus officinalis]XP_020253803.1 transcription repressor OFP3-like [Asparagus officinalis]ONK77471.1 uncharacterized protein A4U43_C02F6860 [Asparagus officinalis]